MKHISILVPEGAILGSLEGSRQLLTQVNQFRNEMGEDPIFKVQLIGLKKVTTVSGGLFTVNASSLINEIDKTDLIIIPAIDGDLVQALEVNKDFIPWIVK